MCVKVFYEVTRRMLRLYHGNGIDKQMIDDLDFIDSLIADVEIQSRVAPRLLNLGIIELCQHIFRKKSFCTKIFDVVNDNFSVGTQALITSLGCAVNLTDISKEACQRVIEVSFHEDIFKFLNLDSVDPSKVKLSYVQSGLADSAMSVVYNAIQVISYLLFVFISSLFIIFVLEESLNVQ